MDADDRIKCQTVVDNYTKAAKEHGTQSQYRRSLEILLPSTPFYDYLEGRVWHPSLTYSRIADITEQEETAKINGLIGQRRTRLGAKIDQVTLDARRDVWADSQLEDIYSAIIDWADDESDTRRDTEEKLLQHAYDHLAALKSSEKSEKRVKVQKVADGLVILKHPFALAWTIAFEWKNVENLGDLDRNQLINFTELFPNHGLSKVIRGYMSSDISPFAPCLQAEEEKVNDQTEVLSMSAEDRLQLMAEGFEECKDATIAARMMTEYYLCLEEYESASDAARKGLTSLAKQSTVSGLALADNKDAINASLGTALIYFQAPRNHPEARALFDGILLRKPADFTALVGVGLVLEEQEHFDQALEFFRNVLKKTSEVKIQAEAAWCQALQGDLQAGLEILEACLATLKTSASPSKTLLAEVQYRMGWCLWELDPSKKARRDREGAYARFLASIQANINYAPPYTRLGVFYADYAKDPKRARKCFQKAFELSPSEVEAAERLARSFAMTKEWDMVQLVSQRVIDSGKCRPSPGSKKKGFSWPFAALGVVHLNSQAYQKSIVSYQAALRISPDDFNSWLGLGEGYASYGRFIAATKALERAIGLCDGQGANVDSDVWFAEYLLGNVKRQLGQYEEAIDLYSKVLKQKPKDNVVTISLLETIVEGAQSSIGLGFVKRGAEMGVEALNLCLAFAQDNPTSSRLWRSFGDACSLFVSAQSYLNGIPIQNVLDLLRSQGAEAAYSTLEDVDGLSTGSLDEVRDDRDNEDMLQILLKSATFAQKLAVHEASKDRYAQASAWYNLGWAEYQAHTHGLGKENKTVNLRKQSPFLKAAVQCFKTAIECEAGNAEFWNAMGVACTDLNVDVAQHSFVRSLHINGRDPRTWTNYGILCLSNNDVELANEAFSHAQAADPDYAVAWLAQGLVAQRLGDQKEARNLFTHALEISDATSAIISKHYAETHFDDILSSPSADNDEDLLNSMMTLRHMLYQRPHDPPAQYLSALFAERAGEFHTAEKALDHLSAKLEQDYEGTESPDTLQRFAQVKSDLARVSLSLGEYDNAFQHATTSIDLSGADDARDASSKKMRWSAHISKALVWLHEGNKADALKELGYLVEEDSNDPNLMCLIARVLWAEGSEQSKTAARDRLFEAAEKFPGHIEITILLGEIAILDGDHDTAEAVADDLRGLQLSEYTDSGQQQTIESLLTSIAAIGLDEAEAAKSAAAEAKSAIMLQPWKSHGWSQLTGMGNVRHAAEMAVLNATKAVPPEGSLDAESLCETYAATRTREDAQRAIVLAPWDLAGRESLREVEP